MSPGKKQNTNIFKYFILFIVPCIWGSYTPLVKGLYTPSTVPIAPPTIIFNLLSYLVSFTTLSLLSLVISQNDTTGKDSSANMSIDEINNKGSNNLNVDSSLKRIPLETTAGIELGLYLFLGSSLQVIGIQGTSALHASILVQLTTVIVPLLDRFLSKSNMSSSLLFSCAMGLLGVFFVASDSGDAIANEMTNVGIFHTLRSLSPSTFNTGDLVVCTAAIFYSLHIVRLNSVAKRVSPIKLGKVKSLTELITSLILLVAYMLYSFAISEGGSSSNEINEYFQNIFNSGESNLFSSGNVYVIGAILWNGMFATALTVWAQTIGQQFVSATTANLIYSSQPIFAAVFSFAFFGSTHFSTNFIIGAAFLIISIFSALSRQDDLK